MLRDLGPSPLDVHLKRASLGQHENSVTILDVPRHPALGVYDLDISFTIGESYIASLGIIMRGHDIGSSAWWRWRTARMDIDYFFNDYTSHVCYVLARGMRYRFVVTGQSNFLGYDDVAVSLDIA